MLRQRSFEKEKKFPHVLHASGQRAKTIKRKMIYFGIDRKTAHLKYLNEQDIRQDGRDPRVVGKTEEALIERTT